MMQDYSRSEVTILERIGMSGNSQATSQEIIEAAKREADKAVKDFDAKWKMASRG